MINTARITAWALVVSLLTAALPSPAVALRPTAENSVTLAGLEESLLGLKIRNAGHRLARYAALAGLMFQAAQGPMVPVPQAAPPTTPPIVQQPTGALAPLREFLGPNRTISIYANDPTTLATDPTVADLFPLAAKAGADTVWVSGFRFRGVLTDAQRRTLAEAAARTGRTIGFVDGNFDWDLLQMQLWVSNFVRGLLGVLPLITVSPADPAVQGAGWNDLLEKAAAAAKNLPVTYDFQVDFEPYIKALRPDWTGDLSGYLSLLIRGTILPLLREFRDAHPEHVRPGAPLLKRFEPWWLTEGAVTDDGAVVSGLIEDDATRRDTAIMSGTYGNTVAGIRQRGQTILARTRATGMTLYFGVETIAGVGTPAYTTNPAQAAADLLEVLRALPPEDFARCGGIFFHAENPKEAHRILTVFVQAPATPPAPPRDALAVSPDGRTAVRRLVSNSQTSIQFWVDNAPAGAFDLPSGFSDSTTTLLPQFTGNNNYLFLTAERPGGADAFAVFGARRPIPGVPTAPAWNMRTLQTPGGQRFWVDRDPTGGPFGSFIMIHHILPVPERPGEVLGRNDVMIRYSPIEPTGVPGPVKTIQVTIEPSGLEEADQFLQEQRLGERATGELA